MNTQARQLILKVLDQATLTLQCLLLGAALAGQAQAAPDPVSAEQLAVHKELVQSKLDAAKELQQKDTEAWRQQFAALDKRVDDQNTHIGQGVDRLGVFASMLGTLVTVLLAALGVFGYFTVAQRAREEAQEAAKLWFEGKATALEKRLQDIEQKASQTKVQMDQVAQGVLDHGEGIKKQNDDALARSLSEMQANIGQGTPSAVGGVSSPEAVAVVQQRADELKKNPEDSYTFDDWNTRAHAANASKNLEDAAFFWLKASQVPNAGALNVARVLLNRGVTQGELGLNQAEISTYDELLRRFGDASEPALHEQLARAMLNKGITQGQLGQHKAEISTYDELLRRFGDVSEPAVREQVAKAMVNKGAAQGGMGQNEAAISTYDELLRRFGGASEPALREQVAMAMVNKGITQGQLGQNEAEITTYDDLLRRFGDASEPALRVQVARAMFQKGTAQGQRGQNEVEISTYDDLLRRLGDASEPALRELVAKAMLNKGITRGQMGQNEAEISTYDELLRRFGDASEPALREAVAKAHNAIGFHQLCGAKALWPVDPARGRALTLEALDHFDRALAHLEPANLNGIIMGNSAYALALCGDTANAESVFAQALRAPVDGGKTLYDGTLTDFAIHPIPEDQAMRELVERQWKIWQSEQGASSLPHAA